MTAAALWQPRIWTPRRPRLWPWLHAMAGHMKRGASGHILRNAAGHIVNECGGGVPCEFCASGDTPTSFTVTFSNVVPCSGCFYQPLIGWYKHLSGSLGTYELLQNEGHPCVYTCVGSGPIFGFYNEETCAGSPASETTGTFIRLRISASLEMVFSAEAIGSGSLYFFVAYPASAECRQINGIFYNENLCENFTGLMEGGTATITANY